MRYGLIAAGALLVPIALFNLAVERDSPDPPVRIARSVALLEIGALEVRQRQSVEAADRLAEPGGRGAFRRREIGRLSR